MIIPLFPIYITSSFVVYSILYFLNYVFFYCQVQIVFTVLVSCLLLCMSFKYFKIGPAVMLAHEKGKEEKET